MERDGFFTATSETIAGDSEESYRELVSLKNILRKCLPVLSDYKLLLCF